MMATSEVNSLKPRDTPLRQINNMVYVIYNQLSVANGQFGSSGRLKREASVTDPEIQELMVTSKIISRFGTVSIDSLVHNPAFDDREITFQILLPEEEFISNFTMLINGEMYVAEVVSKEEAQKRYKEAQKKNVTAGLVENKSWKPAEKVRGMERFEVSVNIGANSSVQFTLNYLELLRRRSGLYQQRISIRPNQIVDHLSISVRLFEQQGITEWQVIEPYGSNSLEMIDTSVYEQQEENMMEINFSPSVERQNEMSTKDEVGLHGDFVVRYDVDHDDRAGIIQISNGFFVHFFSPSDYTVVLPKNVIFVIDISDSMGGIKIDKVRESMPVILRQLKEDDKFMLLLFDDQQNNWPKDARLMPANRDNIEAAIGYVKKNVHSKGGTNINDALVMAAKYFGRAQFGANMIVFLTDGDPTSGVTDTKEIQQNVEKATGGMVSIFSLGYGFSMNFDFLHALSYRNNGMAQRIYDDLDADMQLKSFFDEVGSPLLYDVKLHFPVEIVSSITQTSFPQFFAGSEIVVAGRLKEAPKRWNLTINAMSLTPIMISKPVITESTIQVCKLLAGLGLRQP
jgi:hypothetical protein